MDIALGQLRSRGGAYLRRAIVGDREVDPVLMAHPGDLGLFGPDSVAWKVNSDAAMLVGGLRSLIFQTLHPLAMAGVADHSDYRNDPWGRLQRTSEFVGATTFGTQVYADRQIETVRRVHNRVVGTAPDGRPYEANDPQLLLWVHATEVDSFLDAYRRYGTAQLTRYEADAYVAEMSVVAKRLGAQDVPTSVAELDQTLQMFRPDLHVGRQARDAWRFLTAPPMPLLARGPYGVITAAAVTSLPDWVRHDLKIPVPIGVEPLAVRPAATLLMRGIGWLLSAQSTTETVRATGTNPGRHLKQ